MSFTVQKDVEEEKIKINQIEFFALKKESSYFIRLTSQIFFEVTNLLID